MPGVSGPPDQSDPVPAAPSYLSPYAVEAWTRFAPILAAEGRLKPKDEIAFENLCRLVGMLRQIEAEEVRINDEINPLYWVADTRNGKQMKGSRKISDVQSIVAKINPLLTAFGMTPLDDARIKNPDQGDLFDRLNDALNSGVAS